MTSPKQDKRPKTLIEYMGFKDPDSDDFSHDEWCLKLLNEKLILKIFNKYDNRPEMELAKKTHTIFRHERNHYVNTNAYPDEIIYSLSAEVYNYKVNQKFENITPIIHIEKSIDKLELEHIIVKHGYNGYSQRLGFLDVFCRINVSLYGSFIIDDVEHRIVTTEQDKSYTLFFEIKTSKQTIGSLAREIEFYRDAINEVEGTKSIPILVASEKLPLNQFDVLTFDEILEIERGL